jgi:hypothetical protein
MKLWRSKNLFLIAELLGVFIAFSGHILDPRNKWVVKNILSDYEKANKAYMGMLNNDQEIKRTDPGFDLLLDVISEYVNGPIETISALKARRNAMLSPFGDDIGPSILLTIRDRNGDIYELNIKELHLDIHKRFLEHPLFFWGNVMFYFGLLLTLVLILAEFVKNRGTRSSLNKNDKI